MDGAVALNNTSISMPNIKETKKEVLERIKNKLEKAKLDLIYTELENENISFNKEYSTVKELQDSLKQELSELDYNKVLLIIDRINLELDGMVASLEKGSTNAFTKLMNSDLAKTIAKTLGISLAGRTALMLAPTVATKLAVAGGLSAYGLYRLIKNRREIIKTNETNELNNILMDLEVTKENDVYTDTRFNEETQQLIRDFLKENNIKFKDTGYRSLRQIIYSLDNKTKNKLCTYLNNTIGKGIDIDGRIKASKRKLNVVSTTASSVGTGFLLGTQVANTVNALDPALLAGPLNGTVLGSWIESVSDKKWLSTLTAGVGAAGTEVLEHIPVIGGVATKVFAAENLASLATVGAVGGLAVGAGLGIASMVKRIHTNAKNKQELKKFLELDASKYNEVDKEELIKISEMYHEPDNLVESTVVDIVLGYLKENNITLEDNPRSLEDLNILIEKLPKNEQKIAYDLLNNIYNTILKDSNFAKELRRAGKISIGLFIAAGAALSVYDLIKGGTYLPELSKKIFPENNIYNSVLVPPLDKPYNVSDEKDVNMLEESKELYKNISGVDYWTKLDANYKTAYGDAFIKYNPNFEGAYTGTALVNSGVQENFIDNLLRLLGIKTNEELVPNIPLLCEKIDELSPQKLYELYRYINSLHGENGIDPPMLSAVKQILSYDRFLDKATSYITDLENTQHLHEIVNNVSNTLSTGAIPFSAGVESIELAQKNDIYEEEMDKEKTINK